MVSSLLLFFPSENSLKVMKLNIHFLTSLLDGSYLEISSLKQLALFEFLTQHLFCCPILGPNRLNFNIAEDISVIPDSLIEMKNFFCFLCLLFRIKLFLHYHTLYFNVISCFFRERNCSSLLMIVIRSLFSLETLRDS